MSESEFRKVIPLFGADNGRPISPQGHKRLRQGWGLLPSGCRRRVNRVHGLMAHSMLEENAIDCVFNRPAYPTQGGFGVTDAEIFYKVKAEERRDMFCRALLTLLGRRDVLRAKRPS